MILELVHAALGLAFILFIPGYLTALILFKNRITYFERVSLSIGLSISTNVFIGFLLSSNQKIVGVTGGLTEFNLWTAMIVVSIALFLFYLLKKQFLIV